MKTCKYPDCVDRAIDDYCKREHDSLNPKKVKLQKARSPIKKQSDKTKAALQLYRKMRIEYLKQNPECEVGLSICTHKATEIHHMGGRGKELLVIHNWLAICRNCHTYITENSKEAIQKGFSISRLNKAS